MVYPAWAMSHTITHIAAFNLHKGQPESVWLRLQAELQHTQHKVLAFPNLPGSQTQYTASSAGSREAKEQSSKLLESLN